MLVSNSHVADTASRACFSWLEEIASLLEDSRWTPALEIDGVSLLDAALVPLSLELLSLLRDSSTRPPRRRFRDKVLNLCPQPMLNWLLDQRNGAGFAHRASARFGPSEFVFWPRMANHVDGQAPVASVLRSMGRTTSFVVDYPRLMSQIRHLGMEAVYHRTAWAGRLGEVRRRVGSLRRFLEREPGTVLPAFAGVSPGLVLTRLRNILLTELIHVAEIAASADEMLRSMKPSVVMVGNDLTVEGRTVALKLRGQRVATACLMHGNLSGEVEHEHHIVDRFFVFGNAGKAALLDCGAPEKQVEVTGAAYIKKSHRQSGRVHPDIARLLGLGPNEPWVLVATSGPGHKVSRPHHIALVKALGELSAANPNLPIAVKLHRKDQITYYADALARAPGARLKVVPHGSPGLPDDIWSWLQGCPLVITGASTAGIEALLMEIPVLTIDLCGELSSVDFIAAGATAHVEDGDQLSSAVRAILDQKTAGEEQQKRAKAFLAEAFASLGDEAAHRTAQRLVALAQDNRPAAVC